MIVNYFRKLTTRKRQLRYDIHLGMTLAFIAGAMNAGGFIAVQQYTSHMTGIVSNMAGGIAVGNFNFFWVSLGAMVSFIFGAGLTEMLVNYGRSRGMRSEYALPLIVESLLFLVFAKWGPSLHHLPDFFMSVTIVLLCFMMGMHNSVITHISKAVIRTTHMTGIVTDIGIELGKLFYWNRHVDVSDVNFVKANRFKLYLLSGLLCMFFIGGIVGAYGFKFYGYVVTYPLAAILFLTAIIPVMDDIRKKFR